MNIKLTIQSQHLAKEELQLLIQSIRDCQQKSFSDKEMLISIEAPELSVSETKEILASIKPSYTQGPNWARG